MFYLTSKFYDNRVNTLGFMEGGPLKPPPPTPQTQELQKSPGGIGLRGKKWKKINTCPTGISLVLSRVWN